MSLRTNLILSMSGADPRGIVRGLSRLGLTPPTPDFSFEVDYEERPADEHWLDAYLANAESLKALSGSGRSLTFERSGLVTLSVPDAEISVPSTLHALAEVPYELAVIGQVYPAWYDEAYEKFSFSEGHVPHGFACSFQGAGYGRLVSRRWLEFGPWQRREAGGATWVLFHDIDAPAAEALAQARPGWERMGISDTGGFVQKRIVYKDDLEGVYDPTERKLKVMVPSGDVSQRKMLEIAAARTDPRVQADMALERTAFVFLDVVNARRHLHELWLRDHECWAIVDGEQHRLDDAYQPVPTPPAWTLSAA